MPNGGVGGAGAPIGSFTGPAEALEIIGDHGYAFSGTFGTSSTLYTMLSFTSGNYYLVGTVTAMGAADLTGVGNGAITVFSVSLNGQNIILLKTETGIEDMPTYATVPIVIAPYTEVKVQAVDSIDIASHQTTFSIVGRIYRG